MMKRAIASLLALMLALTLGGCQLAMDEASDRGNDLFVGVSLRIEDWGEPTGLDEEGNPYWEQEVEEEIVDLTPRQAAALMRGEFPEDLLTSEIPIGPYVYYQALREENGERYHDSVNTWPGSVQQHISVSDEGEAYTVNLQVYVCGEAMARHDVDSSFVSMYLDSVYQRSDGSVYCVREFSGVSGQIGGFTQTIRQEQTVTDMHGKVSSYAMEVSVAFIQVPEWLEASVLAFDAEHRLLETMPVIPTGVDDCVIAPPVGTAYMILEETAMDGEGNTVVARSLADMPKTESEWSLAPFTIYIPSENHLAIPCYVRLALPAQAAP